MLMEPLGVLGTQKAHKHKHFIGDIPALVRFIIRGCIWDIPILIFCLCAFLGVLNRLRVVSVSPAKAGGSGFRALGV